MAPLQVGENPFRMLATIDLREDSDHNHYLGSADDHNTTMPMIAFSIGLDNRNRGLKLRIQTIEIRYNTGDDITTNRHLQIFHHISNDKSNQVMNANELWHVEVGYLADNAQFRTLDAEKDNDMDTPDYLKRFYFYPGEWVYLVWDDHYDTTANVLVTFTRV